MTIPQYKNAANSFHHLFWQSLDWVFPPRCAGCSSPGHRFCPDCFSSVKMIDQQKICPSCGIPQSVTTICQECTTINPEYSAVRSWGLYEGSLREAIHHLKYKSDLGVSEPLARPLVNLLVEMDWQIDLVLPVPLSRQRLQQRGYNQSALLTKWISRSTGIKYAPAGLLRTKDTISQVGLSGADRRLNVLGAFSADEKVVSGKSVLVIDDVSTTGATMFAAAHSLKESGAGNIYGLTLARAGHIHVS